MSFIGDNGMTIWCAINCAGGNSISDSHGVSSTARVQSGTYTINFSTAIGNNNYCVLAQSGADRDTWADGDDTNDQGCIVLKRYTGYTRLGGPDWDDGATGDPHKFYMGVFSTAR